MSKKINVAIIGLGQVGASLGKALKAKRGKYFVLGVDKNLSVLKKALKTNAVDEANLNLESAKDADIAVICAPVDAIANICCELSKILRPQTAITDSGSVKFALEKEIKQKNAAYIGSHPMAGTEKNGIDSSRADMYKGAKVVVTNFNKRLIKQEKLVETLWKDAGAKIIKMTAKEHDEIAALTSHLPHVIAFCLNKIYKQALQKNKNADLLTAGSFKSMTRVAVSSADMWAPIFKMNSGNLGKYLKNFISCLKIFEKSLNDKSKLKQEILKTQK